jgi:hypothetical protein
VRVLARLRLRECLRGFGCEDACEASVVRMGETLVRHTCFFRQRGETIVRQTCCIRHVVRLGSAGPTRGWDDAAAPWDLAGKWLTGEQRRTVSARVYVHTKYHCQAPLERLAVRGLCECVCASASPLLAPRLAPRPQLLLGPRTAHDPAKS